ncbi:MAG: hypothetical protein FP820_08475 [Sulfurimonas sp.]|nr:hypothetical protein [Sulfurimonas sp.]MBU1218045.1 hypothetical protein [bacterium]MBU1434792.1 hypothetical protein [bacterium]MBU1502780.1 hypothetical protein [bacterium]MBU3940098.1 hypothetical protein [bacterium]
MKILLRKVTKTPLDFEVESEETNFKGYLQYHAGNLILLKANLSGFVDTECSQCGQTIKLPLDEELEFFISDGLFDGDERIELDVIESFDSVADLDEILHSELELIKSDYFSCENCQNS